ncbi:hypothetical protein HZH68_001160 [Vespula germanica]|uniref:Uncharacterized protein n=1 Tax=Vespula germanica TaxID=30212 RepID=A0A834NV01_VESGE|nr:hypothetical protein HZH68_001160 [Vespula germanica]
MSDLKTVEYIIERLRTINGDYLGLFLRNRCVIPMGMLTANFIIDEIKAKVKIRVASMKYQSIPLIMGYP